MTLSGAGRRQGHEIVGFTVRQRGDRVAEGPGRQCHKEKLALPGISPLLDVFLPQLTEQDPALIRQKRT